MSVTISTPTQINRSQLNTSQSKQLYSFPKTERFGSTKKPICDQFYQLPSSINNRKTTFGYGKKSDFTSGRFKTPAPNTYRISSQIEKQKQTKYGWSFGESRGKMYQSGPVEKHTLGKPGKLQFMQLIINNKIYMSSKNSQSRLKFQSDEFTTADKNPGPGTYEKYETISQQGKYSISKYNNSCAPVFHPPRSKRFQEPNKIPGPGTYDDKPLQLNKTGKYFLQGMENSMVRTFSHNPRHGVMEGLGEKLKVPGVGEYRLPSEFGYYEAAKSTQKL